MRRPSRLRESPEERRIPPPGFTSSLALAVALLATVSAGCRPGEPASTPHARGRQNVVLLSIDTLRRDHLPLYGYPHATAPYLTQYARSAVVFDDALAPHTLTAPSHTSMLSGLYPATHGLWKNGLRVRSSVRLLPAILRQNGYTSAGFVSAAPLDASTGLGAAFDGYDARFDVERGGVPVRAGAETTRRAIAWLEARAADRRPFFLLLHLYEPHFPYQPPARHKAPFLAPGIEPGDEPPLMADRLKSSRRLDPETIQNLVAHYDGEIHLADHCASLFLERLAALGLDRETLVIFVSDHGETLAEREWMFDHGARVFDEQLRIPMVLRFPDQQGAGRRIASPVSLVDLLPTVLEWLGVPAPLGVQGRSLLALLGSDAAAAPRPMFASAKAMPQRSPEIHSPIQQGALVHMARALPWKLIAYPLVGGGSAFQLFDISRDPLETTSLVETQPAEFRRLRGELERWRRSTGADRLKKGRQPSPEVERNLRALGYL